MTTKPKVAFYWCASCGGCEETLVDLGTDLVDVASLVDVVFWPCAMDFKTKDVEALADKAIAVSFINGAIRTSEQEHMVKMLRQKSQLIIAFGSCAVSGGIPALANLTSKQHIMQAAYTNCPSVQPLVPEEKITPQAGNSGLPRFYENVYKLEDIIAVDCFLPGCPPSSFHTSKAIEAILKGTLPPTGATLLPDVALCMSCKRNESKPTELHISQLKRVVDTSIDPNICFLSQGIICMGIATRDGCGAVCVEGNMPCTGCYGSVSSVSDQGAKMVSAIGSIIDGDTKEEIVENTKQMRDLVGTLYRYSLSSSPLNYIKRK